MSGKQEFVRLAGEGKILARKCIKCAKLHMSTVYFCPKCGSKGFADEVLDGRGTVSTYTIITVPPAGFAKYLPYAWVIMSLAGSDLRVSGFMGGIKRPEDLPVGCPAQVSGFDERGLVIEKTNLP